MTDPLHSLVKEAFPADGEASAESLQAALRRHRERPRIVRRRVLALCGALLAITATAVSAKVFLDRQYLYLSGKRVGTVTDRGNGVFTIELSRLPKKGQPLRFEVRDESGRVLGDTGFGYAESPKPSVPEHDKKK